MLDTHYKSKTEWTILRKSPPLCEVLFYGACFINTILNTSTLSSHAVKSFWAISHVNVELVSNISDCLCVHYNGLMWWALCLHAIFVHKGFIHTSPGSMEESGKSEGQWSTSLVWTLQRPVCKLNEFMLPVTGPSTCFLSTFICFIMFVVKYLEQIRGNHQPQKQNMTKLKKHHKEEPMSSNMNSDNWYCSPSGSSHHSLCSWFGTNSSIYKYNAQTQHLSHQNLLMKKSTCSAVTLTWLIAWVTSSYIVTFKASNHYVSFHFTEKMKAT